MNGNVIGNELPELTDEDINILDSICKRAATSTETPNKAIFASYEQVLKEQGIDSRHDGVLFRWIVRIAAPEKGRFRRPNEFLGHLRALLEEHGITVVDDDAEHDTQASLAPVYRNDERRRVSFDDARYEETWLSNHTHTFDHEQSDVRQPASLALRRQPHVRSASTDAQVQGRTPETARIAARAPSSQQYASVQDTAYPSLEQLEEAADAFYDTTLLRGIRKCLQHWYISTDSLLLKRESDEIVAADHDYRLLLRQAWDQWRHTFNARITAHRMTVLQQRHEDILADAPSIGRKRYVWSLWRGHFQDVTAIERPSREHMLRFRYFGRWKAHVVHKQSIAQQSIVRKYAGIWLYRVACSARRESLAGDRYENGLVRGAFATWLCKVRTRQRLRRHQDDVAHQVISRWRQMTTKARIMQNEASTVYRERSLRSSMRALCKTLGRSLEGSEAAAHMHDMRLVGKATQSLKRHASTMPALALVRDSKRQKTLQHTFNHWRAGTANQVAAAKHDRHRVLNGVLRAWNDELRTQTLSKRIEDRVKAEMLYKLMLEERARLCRRSIDYRLLWQCWNVLVSRSSIKTSVDERGLSCFAEESRRRSLTSSMKKLHITIRLRDDAERAAVEFRNGRLIPDAFARLRQKSEHCKTMGKWSSDAAFFVTMKKSLQTWREQTARSLQDKRRIAYERVRGIVKARLLKSAWYALQTKLASINEMQEQSMTKQDESSFMKADQALSIMQRHVDRYNNLGSIALEHDKANIARAAFQTVVLRFEVIGDLEKVSDDLKNDMDLTTLTTILRRLQLIAFTKTRLDDSAAVFQQRRHERNIRKMLRHLSKTAMNRQARAQDGEPDSPSVRQASRAAARVSDEEQERLPRDLTSTPAYLRTPSRARRSSRFRTIPTPAAFTPFTFTPLRAVMSDNDDTVTGQQDGAITPFSQKLRAIGVNTERRPTSIMRARVTGRTVDSRGPATDKSVRFAGSASRFQRRDEVMN